MASPRTRTELYFTSRFEAPPQGFVTAPGRLVLLGEHLDHQGGHVLAMPLPRGVHVAWGIRPDRKVQLHALNARQIDTFELDRLVRSGRRWADMARGAFALVSEGGRRLPGMNLAVYGDLPADVGLASSAAYVTGILCAIYDAVGETATPGEIAMSVAVVEREWAGVACGPMDPYVSMVGKPGKVVHVDCRALEHEILDLPAGSTLDYVPTGVKRRLSDTPYNQRRRELDDALDAVKRLKPGVRRLVDLRVPEWMDIKSDVPEPGRHRAHHVVTEAQRVRRGVEALREGNAERLGDWIQDGHLYLSTSFESSTPEIDRQVAALNREPDVLGARLQGAGWGGSIVVLRRIG